VDSKRIWLPVLTGLLVLGLMLGLGRVGTTASADSPGTTTSTPSTTATTGTSTGTTTDPGTTTNAGTTTAPGTTTMPAGTVTDVTPTQTTATTIGATTSGTTTQPAITQTNGQSSDPASSNQSSGSSSSGTNAGQTTTAAAQTVTDPTPTTPTAPCDTTQITCGNNASTELAQVEQVCNANSDFTTLNVNITTLAGTPVNNLTIDPQTSCLNELSITQIVEQYCEGCSIVVIPPPAPVIYVPVPGDNTVTVEEGTQSYTTTIVNNITTPVEVSTPSTVAGGKNMVAYCLAAPVVQPTGQASSLVYLPIGQSLKGTYAGAFPASYKTGKGMVCANTAETVSDTTFAPTFSLTVPKSFLDEGLRLCASPTKIGGKTVCRTLRIDSGATLTIPVTSNITAKVLQIVKVVPAKSKKQIAAATSAFATAIGTGKTPTPVKTGTPTVTKLTTKLGTKNTKKLGTNK
jgi:hypothetical protein